MAQAMGKRSAIAAQPAPEGRKKILAGGWQKAVGLGMKDKKAMTTDEGNYEL
ncbi:MAG TPA: hypothetical protein VJW77_12610 [Terriglobia bacterium]|nr:hypothetical protein [Terriglobia bacterium]